MSFSLQSDNILSVEVFVNEFPRLTNHQIRTMMEQRPADIRYSQNRFGNMTEFFVRWEEVPSFDHVPSGGRYYTIDRMNNTISFGDGVKVLIPPAQTDVAFTVQVTRCEGEAGNLPVGSISQPQRNLDFIGEITNRIPTFSGSNMETLEQAHNRGGALLTSRGRLVSQMDYQREAAVFSSAVHKVRCACGRDIYGRGDDRLITVAVLMKEAGQGPAPFENIKDRMKEHLLALGAGTLEPEELVVAEPLFVELMVSVWISITNIEQSLEIQSKIAEAIRGFLDPVHGSYDGKGWEIGSIVNQSQINMLIKSVPGAFSIDKVVLAGRYKDRGVVRETDHLEHLRNNPFILGINGEHKIVVALL
jgi:hypothetical protein